MWARYRRTAGKWSEDAKRLNLAKLKRLYAEGNDPTLVIEQSIERGWTGLFEVKQSIGATNARQTFAQQRTQAEIDDFVNGPADDKTIEMEVRRVGD